MSSIPHQRKYIKSKIKLGNGGPHPNHTGKLERNFQTTMENNKFSTLERMFMEKYHPPFVHSFIKQNILQSATMLRKQRGKSSSRIRELPWFNPILASRCLQQEITQRFKLFYLVDLKEMERRDKDKYLQRILLEARKKVHHQEVSDEGTWLR